MKQRKMLAKLKRRQDAYDNTISKLSLQGYHRPGSLKK